MDPRPFRFFSFLLLAFILGCESNSDETTPPGLTGAVLSSGEPVEGASVSLDNDKQQYTSMTDAQGKFEFKEILSGDYVLTIKSEGEEEKFIQAQNNVNITTGTSDQIIQLPEGVILLEPSNVGGSSIDLTWNKAKIPDFLEYKLYRHSTTGLDETTGTLIHVATNVNDTVFIDTDLIDNQTYYYRVFVRNAFSLYGGSNIREVLTAQVNYIFNGDFEQGLSGWELFSPEPCVEIGEDPFSPTGATILKAEISDISKANISSELFQNINHIKLIEGKTYTLSFWAKAELLPETSVFYVFLLSNDNWNRVVSIKLDKNSSSTWTKYTKDFIAPGGSSPYSLFIYAEPHIPWTGQPLRVLVDGITLQRK